MGLNFIVCVDVGILLDFNEWFDEDVIVELVIIEVGGLVNNDIFFINDVMYVGIMKFRYSFF